MISNVIVRPRGQSFIEIVSLPACIQAKAARQERIKALSKMPGIPDGG